MGSKVYKVCYWKVLVVFMSRDLAVGKGLDSYCCILHLRFSCDRQSNLEANDPCRNWYNETTLEALTPAARPPQGLGGGVAIDTSDRKRVQVVRRKQRPTTVGAGTRQQQVGVINSILVVAIL